MGHFRRKCLPSSDAAEARGGMGEPMNGGWSYSSHGAPSISLYGWGSLS